MSHVTKEDVFTAADLLAEEGKMPSILMVRKVLGDRGSETTLGKYLKEWKDKLLESAHAGCVFCQGKDGEIKELKAALLQVKDKLQVSLDWMRGEKS